MGAISNWRDSVSVRAATTSHGLSAELNGHGEVRLSFPPGVYRSLTDSAVARELAQLARTLWVRRTASHQDMLRREFGRDAPRQLPPSCAADHEFDERLSKLVAEGFSADGRIRIATRGLTEWKVTVAPGTLRALREIEFEVAVAEAVRALTQNQAARVKELKELAYGPISPPGRATRQGR